MSTDPKIRIYLDGKYADSSEHDKKMVQLGAMGHEITHNWTKNEELFLNDKASISIANINGVKNADILIIIMDDENYAYRGTFVELGVALACNKKVFVLCPHFEKLENNVFLNHPNVMIFDNWYKLIINTIS